MRPLNTTLDPDQVCQHRKEECLHYHRCLMKASQLRWHSFSCQGCEDYHQGGVPRMEIKRCSALAEL